MSEKKSLELKWPTPSEIPPLGSNEVHVWAVPLDAGLPPRGEVGRTLSAEELRRAAGFAFDRPRDAFVATRLALRKLLGRYLERPPHDVSIVIDRNGKPQLATGEINFNLSHSGKLALVAITRQSAIGVDIEQVRPVDHLHDIAERHFHPLELAAIRAAGGEDAAAAFLRIWTRKEAVLKTIGAGLHFPLSAFHVPGSTMVQLSAHGDVSESKCFLHDVDPCESYVGSVATQTPETLLGFTYSP